MAAAAAATPALEVRVGGGVMLLLLPLGLLLAGLVGRGLGGHPACRGGGGQRSWGQERSSCGLLWRSDEDLSPPSLVRI